jgi:hypothetical protein
VIRLCEPSNLPIWNWSRNMNAPHTTYLSPNMVPPWERHITPFRCASIAVRKSMSLSWRVPGLMT